MSSAANETFLIQRRVGSWVSTRRGVGIRWKHVCSARKPNDLSLHGPFSGGNVASLSFKKHTHRDLTQRESENKAPIYFSACLLWLPLAVCYRQAQMEDVMVKVSTVRPARSQARKRERDRELSYAGSFSGDGGASHCCVVWNSSWSIHLWNI